MCLCLYLHGFRSESDVLSLSWFYHFCSKTLNFHSAELMNSHFETNVLDFDSSVWLNSKSLLQNPNMRWEQGRRERFPFHKAAPVSLKRQGQLLSLFKALHQIIHSCPFMFLELKEKRWSRKSGINQRSLPRLCVSASACEMQSFLSQFRGQEVQLWEL